MRIIIGNVEKYEVKRTSMGPLELKNTVRKTLLLDIGALQKIKSSEIKIVPGIKNVYRDTVEFVNGESLDIDSVVLATGYHSNVPSWFKVRISIYWSDFSISIYILSCSQIKIELNN